MYAKVTNECFMAKEKGTMNKFRFLLTCSNEQDDDLIKNINTSQANGDVFDKWRILCSSTANPSQINFVLTKVILACLLHICFDSSPFPAQPSSARVFLLVVECLCTEPF